MPEKRTLARARRDRRQGKAATTQAGEFVREEFEHVRQGKHGARSPEQAIAIGLSKARRSGVEVKPPRRGAASAGTRHKAQQDLARGRSGHAAPRHHASTSRSRATSAALRREGHGSASHAAISRQARSAAARGRGSSARASTGTTGRTTSARRGRTTSARRTGGRRAAARGRRAGAAR